ncbi:MAG: serine/threonine-protein kinase [Chloroflexota bacterium]
MDDIADRFDLGARVGGDGSADVYRAFDHELHRDVVLRIARADVISDAEYVRSFEREAEAASGIRHPNIAEVLDHGTAGGRPFLVRQLVEGDTLAARIERHGALPEDEARSFAEQLARGLAAAHARGVLHRDLHAGNVIVTADGVAKIVDFGVPAVPRHPSPEQVAGQSIDERADVYGLGAVLYQMLTGHVPRGRPVSPTRLGRRVSKGIAAVAMRALERDPARRYPTVAAMGDALVGAAPAPVIRPALVRPAAVRPPPVRPQPVRAAPGRRRVSAVPFALIGIALLFFAIAALALLRPPARTAVLSATTTPVATATATLPPPPTSLPPVETTPEPTPAAPPESPTAFPSAPIAAQTPATAVVASFYDLVEQKRYDEAAALWSARLQATYPPATNIYGRFDRTRQIVLRGLAQTAQSGATATVTVDLLEVLDSGVTRHWVGQWQMIWDGSRWLMDAPNLRAA